MTLYVGSDHRSKLFDTKMVFTKEFFEKDGLEKNQRTTKKHKKIPGGKRAQVLQVAPGQDMKFK